MSNQTVRTRFAPSPTGYLHVGGARTALFNWLFARHHGGELILRVEDTDEARNTDEARAAIFDGLRWLGLDWDGEPFFQSQRTALYERHLQTLLDADRAYIDDQGATRFRVPDTDITVEDVICGSQTVNLAAQGATRWDAETKKEVAANPDIVIRRADGAFLFHFVNVVDDLDMGMTHVIRGEDHLSNTPKHVALFEALGANPPVFAHLPLILNKDGSKMSKRDTGASVQSYIDEGFLPQAVCNYLVLLGWSPKDDSEVMPTTELIERFDIAGINRSNAKFDMEKCQWMNAQHLVNLDDGAFLTAARAFNPELPGDPLLLLAKPKLKQLNEITALLAPVLDEAFELDTDSAAKAAKNTDAPALIAALRERLSATEEWNEDAITTAIQETAAANDAKPGALMFPLRLLATGQGKGVDLKPALVAIGKGSLLRRIDTRLPLIYN